jgi:pyruvate/2-oxoglutarate dehydrogenase complex dihydrolipoamide acyltransferase (E2) component
VIGKEGDEVPAELATASTRSEEGAATDGRVGSAGAGLPAAGTAAGGASTADTRPAGPSAGNIRISPLARKLAREHKIDLEELKKSASGPVVKKEDIEAFIAGGAAADAAAPHASDDTIIELKGIRKTMFERMTKVASTYAATTTIQRADVTRLIELKQDLTGRWDENANPRYITFFLKAVSMAIPDFPIINSTVDDEAGIIRVRKAINIGIAVDSDRGLIVPVIHDAAGFDLEELSTKTNELVARAAANSLSAEDFRDGTFTITNAGPLGAYVNTPMINPPQSAILGTCSINEEPAVVDGRIIPRKLMFLSLTYDHRIIQGSEAVGFLKRIVGLLEEPGQLLA